MSLLAPFYPVRMEKTNNKFIVSASNRVCTFGENSMPESILVNGNELRLMFDPDFSRESISPNKKMRLFAQHSSVGKDFVPVKVAETLVRSFEVLCNGETVFADDLNRLALRRIPLNVTAKTLTVRFTGTWGKDEVHLFSADVK